MVTAAGVPSCVGWPLIGSLTTTARPARSAWLAGATRSNDALSWMGPTGSRPSASTAAVTVPLPTWQAATGVLAFRQAPPSMAALASRPGRQLEREVLGACRRWWG